MASLFLSNVFKKEQDPMQSTAQTKDSRLMLDWTKQQNFMMWCPITLCSNCMDLNQILLN